MVHPEKLNQVLALSEEQRFGYFVRKCADFERVWGLHSDEWLFESSKQRAFPVWPEAEFARIYSKIGLAEFEVQSMSVDEFLGDMISQLKRGNLGVCVFPTQSCPGSVVSATYLERCLLDELKQYE